MVAPLPRGLDTLPIAGERSVLEPWTARIHLERFSPGI